MAPFPARLYVSDMGTSNAIFRSDLSVDAWVASDFSNLIFSKFGAAMGRSASRNLEHSFPMPLARHTSFATQSIVRVFDIPTPPQMGRINARRVVARMQCERPKGPRVTRQRKRNMGSKHRNGPSALSLGYSSVATPILAGGPSPALIRPGLFNLRPKACFQPIRNRRYSVVSHSASPRVRGQGRALLTQRFRPVLHSRFTLRSQTPED